MTCNQSPIVRKTHKWLADLKMKQTLIHVQTKNVQIVLLVQASQSLNRWLCWFHILSLFSGETVKLLKKDMTHLEFKCDNVNSNVSKHLIDTIDSMTWSDWLTVFFPQTFFFKANCALLQIVCKWQQMQATETPSIKQITTLNYNVFTVEIWRQ